MRRLFFVVISIFLSINSLTAQVTSQEAIVQMRKGINLGNTHESPTEAGWGNPKAQESYFDMYRDAGFNTVRIPVRWDNYTDKQSPYKVQDAWLNRIEEVVDWGLERDLWIVINSHHDDWIKDNYSAENQVRFDSIWSQIATHFAAKSEKLIFEILNEPYGMTREDNDDMHARVLSIIRKNNPTRLVIFQGNNWGSSGDLINAAIPDPDDEYLIGSFHSYDPWPFGLEGTGSFGTEAQINTLRNKFISVKNWSDRTNIPVFLGEFACHDGADFMSRMKHYQTYVELSHEYGFCYCAWDDGGNFRIMNRSAGTWKEMKDILIYGNPGSPGYPEANIQHDSIIRISWDNRVTDNDHIIVQRGLSATSFKTIDTISAEAREYLDVAPRQDQTYYYRVIAAYEDSVSYYSHPVVIYLPEYIMPGFDIRVQLKDKTNGNAVQLADVVFNGVSQSTDYSGEVDFIEYEGVYDLSIEKEYYLKIEEQIKIISDTILICEMEPTHSDVKIWVKDTSEKPLKNASVTFGDTEIITESLGLAKYLNLPLLTSYDYTVHRDGFEDVTGALFLEKDTVFTIVLTPAATGLAQETFSAVKVWPNPVYEILQLEFPGNEGRITICDMDGKVRKEIVRRSGSAMGIDVSDFTDGIYLIKVSTGNSIFYSTFIKMKPRV